MSNDSVCQPYQRYADSASASGSTATALLLKDDTAAAGGGVCAKAEAQSSEIAAKTQAITSVRAITTANRANGVPFNPSDKRMLSGTMGFGKVWALSCLVLAGCSNGDDESSRDGDSAANFVAQYGRTCEVLRACYPEAQAIAEPSTCLAPFGRDAFFIADDSTQAARWQKCMLQHPDQAATKAWLECMQPHQRSAIDCYEACPTTLEACVERHQPFYAECTDGFDLEPIEDCLNAER